jgi:3-mercaptopyruvate sulfurtransferase SseA
MAEPHNGGRLKRADEIRAVLSGARLAPEKPTVIYCAAGIRTAHAYFVLSLLGWDNIRGYDASMAEWAKPRRHRGRSHGLMPAKAGAAEPSGT